MPDWEINRRYTYPTKEMCVRAAAKANEYYGGLLNVAFERAYTTFSFWLCDPFEEV